MNEFQIFRDERFGEIRTLTIDGESWFVGKDVAAALGYAKARNAIAAHVDPEDKKDAPIQGTLGGPQNMTLINESGVYALIFGSKLESAKAFKRWVTRDVLPAIRKTGEYGLIPVEVPPVVEQRVLTTDDYLKAALLVSNCRNERLPYVLGFLEQGGFSMPKLKTQAENTGKKLSNLQSFPVDGIGRVDSCLLAQEG